MTFNFAPWAVDGARTGAALARILARAATGGRSGIVSPLDLRVLPLAVNGNGVRISSGNGVVLNHYLSDPDQSYVVSNPATHTMLPADMPPPVPQTSYYLVCVVVGDPEFDQTGHPFMPGTPLAPEDAADFEYVRPVIIPCAANTTSFEQLGYNFPAVALARLEIPPNTTTITAPMITDLRELVQPRSERKLITVQPSAGLNLTAGSYAQWTDAVPYVFVPEWATHAEVLVHIAGALHMDPEVQGSIRVRLGGLYGVTTTYVFDDSTGISGGERVNLITSASGPVGNMRGTNQPIVIEGYKDTSFAGFLGTFAGQTHVYDIQFTERLL